MSLPITSRKPRRWPGRIVLACLLVDACLVLGCGSARVNHFKGFAQAGAVYTKAADTVLTEAGTAAIDTDSMVLEGTRPELTPQERGQKVLEHNKLLRERLALLGDLKRHGQLLRSYFEALAALAESKAASGIEGAAKGVVDSLGKLHKQIASAKVGGMAVSGFVGAAAKIAVANLRRSALENELKANAGTIERELDLQQAALTAVGEQMKTDLQAQLLRQESREVVLPYRDSSPLPASWSRRRREILEASVAAASLASAAEGARKLKVSFIGLVEGRFTESDLPTLISDINEVVSLMEKIRGKTAPSGQ